jgi:hypothetical protein
MGSKMVAAAVVWMPLVRSGRRRPDSEADEQAPHGFTFF